MLTITVIGIIPMMIVAVLRLVLSYRPFQVWCSDSVTWIAETWAATNKLIFNTLTSTHWDVRGNDRVDSSKSYLLVCNHQSWVDIPAIVQVFNRRTPFFRFFLKQELIWVPFLGLAWWALEFPFMKRYSKEVLARKPHLRGKDLEATRKACETFRNRPVTFINFPEGTRFKPHKQAAQQSPYRHLLKAKAGGIAFVLESMEDQIDTLLDVTIAYPNGTPTFWELISGQVSRVVIDIRQLPVTDEWKKGRYQEDPEYRAAFQKWVSDLWQEKDGRIESLKQS